MSRFLARIFDRGLRRDDLEIPNFHTGVVVADQPRRFVARKVGEPQSVLELQPAEKTAHRPPPSDRRLRFELVPISACQLSSSCSSRSNPARSASGRERAVLTILEIFSRWAASIRSRSCTKAPISDPLDSRQIDEEPFPSDLLAEAPSLLGVDIGAAESLLQGPRSQLRLVTADGYA